MVFLIKIAVFDHQRSCSQKFGIRRQFWNLYVCLFGEPGDTKLIDGLLYRGHHHFPGYRPPAAYHDNITYLADVLSGKTDPGNDLSSLPNNLIVVRILDAASRSAREGRRITL